MSSIELRNAFQSMQNIHNQLNNRMSLTPDQIKQRNIQRLRDDMITAQNKVQNSPEELKRAQRAYYLEAKGSDYYSNFQRGKYKTEAQSHVNTWNKEMINNLFTNITNSIYYYNSQENYVKNVDDVYKNYDSKLSDLEKKIYDTENIKNVNERLGQFYYNNTQDVDWLSYYLKIMYYGLIIVSVVIFMVKSQFRKIKMYVFFLTVLLMPYLLNKYYTFIMGTFKHFKLDNVYFIFILTIISLISLLNFASTLPFN